MRNIPVVACAVLTARVAFAQVPLTGPVEGFTFDTPTGSFRAVIGIPGSAALGPALSSGWDSGWVATRRDYAIAFRGETGSLISGFRSGQIITSALPDTSRRPQGVIWSGNGSRAVLYSQTDAWIQLLTGLPDRVNARDPVQIPALGKGILSVAIDTTGRRIAAGTDSGVYLLDGGADPKPVLSITTPIALTFSLDGRTLYALDGATRQISELNLLDLKSQTWPLDGLNDPVAISVDRGPAGERLLYIATGADRVLRMYDLSRHQTLAEVPLDFQPVSLEALGLHSFVLRPRTSDSDPLWSFTNTSRPMVYFIPATPLASGGNQ